jgi:hypothetical protein
MTTISPTPANTILASKVNHRLHADAVMLTAKASLWRMGGFGLLALGIGSGVALALFAYSYIVDVSTSANKIADALTVALARNPLTVEGDVKIAPDQLVKLADGGSVSLAPNAKVGLEPNSRVQVEGNITANVPRPSEVQLRGSNVPTERGGKIITNYTVFKSVSFGVGKVVSGWTFSSSEQTVPDTQYCYYGSNVEDAVYLRVDLAENGVATPMTKAPKGIDPALASDKCIWFDGSQTKRTTSFQRAEKDEPNIGEGKGKVY